MVKAGIKKCWYCDLHNISAQLLNNCVFLVSTNVKGRNRFIYLEISPLVESVSRETHYISEKNAAAVRHYRKLFCDLKHTIWKATFFNKLFCSLFHSVFVIWHKSSLRTNCSGLPKVVQRAAATLKRNCAFLFNSVSAHFTKPRQSLDNTTASR